MVQVRISSECILQGKQFKIQPLTYWKNKFKRQNLPVEFIQIPQVKIATTTNSQFRDVLRLNIESGFQIEVPDGFSQTTLLLKSLTQKNRIINLKSKFLMSRSKV